MKVAVIGATGRTGQPLVETLLSRGHSVVALARDPAKLGEAAPKVTVVTGSSTDLPALRELVADTEVLISTLGPTKKESDLHTRTAQRLTEVLAPGSRFVGVSGAGIDVPGDQKGPKDRAISFMIRKLGGALAADKASEYEVFAASPLDWTLVRPPRLLDGAPTGKVSHDAHKPGKSSSIRRADLAAFLVEVAEQDLYSHQAPFVCGG